MGGTNLINWHSFSNCRCKSSIGEVNIILFGKKRPFQLNLGGVFYWLFFGNSRAFHYSTEIQFVSLLEQCPDTHKHSDCKRLDAIIQVWKQRWENTSTSPKPRSKSIKKRAVISLKKLQNNPLFNFLL